MKNKITKFMFFFMIFIVHGKIQAQIYHKMLADSTRWNVGYDGIGFDNSNSWSTKIYTAMGDTIIDSTKFKFFHDEQNDSYYTNSFLYIREDTLTQRVFYRINKNSKEVLLYDFSLEKGDSITISFPRGNYNARYKVSDKIKNSSGDTIFLYLDSAGKYCCYPPSHLTWIEGVGCTLSFIYPFEMYVIDGPGYELLCAYQNGRRTYLNSTGFPCNLFVSIDENEKKTSRVDIYPNPSTSNFSLSFSDAFTGNIVVYDVIGNIRYRKDFVDESEMELDLSVSSGIYVLKLTDNKGGVYIQKLIME